VYPRTLNLLLLTTYSPHALHEWFACDVKQVTHADSVNCPNYALYMTP